MTTCNLKINYLSCFIILHFLGTREVAKPTPKKPKEGEENPMLAPTIIHKPAPKENFFMGLIDKQLHEDSLCSKMAKFFQQVRQFETQDT